MCSARRFSHRGDCRLVGACFGRWREETFGRRARCLTLRYSLPLSVWWVDPLVKHMWIDAGLTTQQTHRLIVSNATLHVEKVFTSSWGAATAKRITYFAWLTLSMIQIRTYSMLLYSQDRRRTTFDRCSVRGVFLRVVVCGVVVVVCLCVGPISLWQKRLHLNRRPSVFLRPAY